ncbi:MAG: hypothetical protein GY943_16530 [Chloroflexi bacterium]|nr:hypothetical protein [Chloroflexota bacterium]
MPWFGWMSERLQKLIDCALVDEKFRAELFHNRDLFYARFELSPRDIEVLEKNLFDETETEEDFDHNLAMFGRLSKDFERTERVA